MEKVQEASPLASMSKGEYERSTLGASIVIGPPSSSSRSRSSATSVIFTVSVCVPPRGSANVRPLAACRTAVGHCQF